jgi:glucose/mannose transport system substrate-binding protein
MTYRSLAALLLLAACGGDGEQPVHQPLVVARSDFGFGPRNDAAWKALTEVATAEVPGLEISSVGWTVRCGGARTCYVTSLDVGQVDLAPDLDEWVTRGLLESLDKLAMEQGWASVIPPSVLESGRSPTDGKLYGAPFSVRRDNTLFYNKSVLAQAGMAPPKTIPEMLAAANTLTSRGVTPLAVSASGGWSVALGLFDVLLAEAGPQFYLDYLSGLQTADAAEMAQAITDLAELMRHSNADRATTGWGDAVGLVCRGQAAMTFLGDFATEWFEYDGCEPDAVGYVALEPPGAPSFLFNSMGFGLGQQGGHHDTAVAFLKTAGSKAGQEAFGAVARIIPARTDVDVNMFDAMSQQTLLDFRSPTERLLPSYAILTSVTFQAALNPALQQFADPASLDFQNVGTVLEVLKQNYAHVRP